MVDALNKETDNITVLNETQQSLVPHALATLRSSEIRYRRLFESARDGILILNATTLEITDVNPFMTELLDYSREEFLGKELWEIGLFSDRRRANKRLENCR